MSSTSRYLLGITVAIAVLGLFLGSQADRHLEGLDAALRAERQHELHLACIASAGDWDGSRCTFPAIPL